MIITLRKMQVGIIIVLIIGTIKVNAQGNFYFTRYGVEDGLPQNTVNCILQDSVGFIWFGTKDGLSRYDGYSFCNFRHDRDDTLSIGNNFIRSLFQNESNVIWIGTDAGVYLYHVDTETFTCFDAKTEDDISIEKEVNDIKADKEGNIWFAVDWQGVFKYSEGKLSFYDLNVVNAWTLCVDYENNIWVGAHGGLLNRYDKANDRFELVADGKDTGGDIYTLFQDNYNDIIIGTSKGIRKLNLSTGKITSVFFKDEDNALFIRDIARKSDNELYIGAESGVYICNTENQTVTHIEHDPFDPYSLSDNAVYSLMKDREGGIWTGTYFGGVNYCPPAHTTFRRHYQKNTPASLHGKRIREFQEDRYGALWIGTEDAGLNRYDPKTGTYKSFMPDGTSQSIVYHNIHGLLIDGDNLWVGTFMNGLNVMDVRTQKVIKHYSKSDKYNSLCDNSIMAIFKDDSNRIWFGTIYGLCYYEPENETFIKIEHTNNLFITCIFQSYDAMMWFGSFNAGVFRYNPRAGEWKNFVHDPANPFSLPHNKIISIFEDGRKNVWFTTEGGGICRYNRDDETFKSYSTKDGLPNDVVYKMLEDNRGRLWLTTNNGLACFNPETGHIKTYTSDDGLLGNQFNYEAGYKSSDGRLFFGCLNGFISFDPLSFTENTCIPPVVITNVKLFNGDDKAPRLKKNLNTAKRLDLEYNQSSFSIDFAALSYVAPKKNRYSYKLEGLDTEWSHTVGTHSVSYSNIPSGDYVFHLKGSNNDGLWNDIPILLTVSVHPPFYKSRSAYVLYSVLLLMALLLIVLYLKRRFDRHQKERLQVLENEKNKEVYNSKIAFFNTIAHEIRTPLSLIKGPVEYMLENEISNEDLKENLKVVERNTNRLLDLSNQLLDFRKMEGKGFKINYIRTDINQLVTDIFARFRLSVKQHRRFFELHLPPEPVFADIDHEAFTKIVSNLFTNAIKYADKEIVLILEKIDDLFLRLTVKSDGTLIPEEMKEMIFEPFFRIGDDSLKAGIGLGLPLARSLAKLHKGSLALDTSSGTNGFVLQLPVNQTETNGDVLDDIPSETPQFSGKPTILLVEDESDMRRFISDRLRGEYNVIKAPNGKKALEILQYETIDIIITDVIMPEIDGLQLCSAVKSNLDTSHIPVVMLTAKADLKSRIEGLDAGADAYVEKPFSMEHLKVQILNILTNRNKLRTTFINSPVQNTGSIALTQADEMFLNKATQVINKYLSDIEFNVDVLAEELSMSRSSLHRKIKGLSELTPNDFIQLVRLKKAAELLHSGLYRINEVCYLVGFGSSSYFAKIYKRQFGVSPKDVKKVEK
ncbi:MAG: response regulator [Tannerella sp.]|jgi:ligand-binding sensor domain-containing protein/signal transduction histidine kinase/DNA-binding response OmpR family regulator|nr:response regulator [Tannerella sp.]